MRGVIMLGVVILGVVCSFLVVVSLVLPGAVLSKEVDRSLAGCIFLNFDFWCGVLILM